MLARRIAYKGDNVRVEIAVDYRELSLMAARLVARFILRESQPVLRPPYRQHPGGHVPGSGGVLPPGAAGFRPGHRVQLWTSTWGSRRSILGTSRATCAATCGIRWGWGPSGLISRRVPPRTGRRRWPPSGGEKVPKKAITMGIQTIMNAREILLLVSGRKKAGVLSQALTGPVTPEVPA